MQPLPVIPSHPSTWHFRGIDVEMLSDMLAPQKAGVFRGRFGLQPGSVPLILLYENANGWRHRFTGAINEDPRSPFMHDL